MVLGKAQIGNGTLTLKVFAPGKLRKPIYTVVFMSDSTVRGYKRNYGELKGAELTRAMKIAISQLPDATFLRHAIQILLGNEMNIAYAYGLTIHADSDQSVVDWIESLPATYRNAATQAHHLLQATLDGYPRLTVEQIAPLAKGDLRS